MRGNESRIEAVLLSTRSLVRTVLAFCVSFLEKENKKTRRNETVALRAFSSTVTNTVGRKGSEVARVQMSRNTRVWHKNSHILSTEYEDTRQAHTTLRKRKDRTLRDQIEETTQDREEGVQIVKVEEVEDVEKERKKEQEEIEEEIIILERDSKGRLIRKKKQDVEKQIDVIEEEETIEKIKKAMVPKRPDIGKDEIELEEIEEFEVIKDK